MKSHKTCWKLNMLWSEKISFVKKAYNDKYFPETEWYGWCDIGYFRGDEPGDILNEQIKEWPNYDKLKLFDKDKVYYARVNKKKKFETLFNLINMKNKNGLPKHPIPPEQWSIAGGFFIIYKKKIDWWFDKYDKKLALYFDNNYLVKDDQIIIVDNICSEYENIGLITEKYRYVNCEWFVFQRYLL